MRQWLAAAAMWITTVSVLVLLAHTCNAAAATSDFLDAAAAESRTVTDTQLPTCTGPGDCSLLGDCIAGACMCDSGWAGPRCSTLLLLPPAPVEHGGSSYVAPGGFSSWGMSIVHDGVDGL